MIVSMLPAVAGFSRHCCVLMRSL
jgi:hypothetical protein